MYLTNFAALACLSSCGPPAGQRDTGNAATVETVRPTYADASDVRLEGWTVQSGTDPITDVESVIAARTFQSGNYLIELAVSCDSQRAIIYSATTFDKTGAGAPLEWDFTSSGTRIAGEARVDQQRAIGWSSRERRYSNQFIIPSHGEEFARGQDLTLRFPMPNADATIFVDQTDPDFRGAVESCLTAPETRSEETASDMAEEGVAVDPTPAPKPTDASETVANEQQPLQ